MDNQEQKWREEFNSHWKNGGSNEAVSFADSVTQGGLTVRYHAAVAFYTAKQSCAAELAELKAWKESAIAVMPDYQAIGNIIGVGLGDSVHDMILPALEAKDKKIAELSSELASSDAALRESRANDMAAMAQVAELKEYLSKFQLSEFNPDWSLLQASQESLREHMAMVKELTRKNAELSAEIQHMHLKVTAKLDDKIAELEANNARMRELLIALKPNTEVGQWLATWREDFDKALTTPASDWLEQRDREVAAKAVKPRSYAGVKIWCGEHAIMQEITQPEIEHERVAGNALTRTSQYCLDMLAKELRAQKGGAA